MEGAKLPAPPFVTTPILSDSIEKINRISIELFKTLKYGTCSEILKDECYSLQQFVNQKQIQCRSQKAMYFTEEMKNLLANPFQDFDFDEELMNFKNAFRFPAMSGVSGGTYSEGRGPSYQWLKWLIYVLQREAVLLAKIKHECEQAMEIWLAMISASQSFDDCSAIASMISRIWYLSGVILEELDSKIYPFLFQLTNILEPETGSLPWPEPGGPGQILELPRDTLVDWLQNTLNLPFQPVHLNSKLLSLVEKDSGWILRAIEVKDEITESKLSSDQESLARSITDSIKSENVSPGGGENGVRTKPPRSNFEAATSSGDHNDKKQNVNLRTRLTNFKRITYVKQFQEYWEQLFGHLTRLDPKTDSAREEMLRRIGEYKVPEWKQFSFGLTKMWAKLKPDLINLEQVVRAYGSYPTHELFLSEFVSRHSVLQAQVVRLADAKLEQQAQRCVKREQRQSDRLARGFAPKMTKNQRRAKAKLAKSGAAPSQVSSTHQQQLSSLVPKISGSILQGAIEVKVESTESNQPDESFSRHTADSIKCEEEDDFTGCGGYEVEEDCSSNDGESQDSQDEEHLPPWKKVKTEPQASTSSLDLQNANEPKQPKITTVPIFEQFWKGLLDVLDPTTAAGRKEALHRIENCKFGSSKCTLPFKRLCRALHPDLISIGVLMKEYDDSDFANGSNGTGLSHDQFIARFNLMRKNLHARVEKLADRKWDRVVQKRGTRRKNKLAKKARKRAARQN